MRSNDPHLCEYCAHQSIKYSNVVRHGPRANKPTLNCAGPNVVVSNWSPSTRWSLLLFPYSAPSTHRIHIQITRFIVINLIIATNIRNQTAGSISPQINQPGEQRSQIYIVVRKMCCAAHTFWIKLNNHSFICTIRPFAYRDYSHWSRDPPRMTSRPTIRPVWPIARESIDVAVRTCGAVFGVNTN